MLWLLPALLGAFFKSSSSFFRKKASKNLSGSVFLWVSSAISTIIIFPFAANSLHTVKQLLFADTLILLGIVLPLMAATIMNVKALSKGELSLVAPLNGFVPVFTLLIAWITLGELPPIAGISGVIIVVAGTYIMGMNAVNTRWYQPIFFLLRSPAALLSIAVAISYAVNTTFIKSATNAGYSPVVVLFCTVLGCTLLSSYVLPVRSLRSQIISSLTRDRNVLFAAIVSSLLANYLHMVATSLTYASYAIAARRFDTIFSVLLGWKYLQESSIRTKLTSSAVIVLGCVFLAIG